MTPNDTALESLLELLRTSSAVPDQESSRHPGPWSPENVESHEAWETTRESQIEHLRVRVDLDTEMRNDGLAPAMVGFSKMLASLERVDVASIEFHQLVTKEAAFLVCTDIGTTMLIGMLWSFDSERDAFRGHG